ncbi:MAG: CHASE2 domain-containing protein [Candidatus Omnitrophica bacterium]|nr:CHASE2 domain-containing protein [Candidatus Omnitrophota bacterium]
MTPLKNPPAGLLQTPESFFRRKQRQVAFYFSTTFRLHLIHFSCCLLIIGFHMLVMKTPLMERFENVSIDFFFRQRPPIAMHPAIVHIDMAEDSLQALGRWPWPRHNHAAMIHILHEWGAKAIVFDVIFSESSTTFDDESLAQAVKEAGNVYSPVMLESLGSEKAWVHSLPEFERNVKGIGHVNIFPDRDGTIRRVMPLLSHNGETYPYLGAKVAFDYLGKDMLKDKIRIPIDQEGRIFINWVGRWKDSFRHYSFLDVIKSYADIREGRPALITPDKIKDKICVIGLTALGLTDIKANPMEAAYPAVGVQTNIMNGILMKKFARPVAPRWNRIALLVIGLFLSFFFLFSRQVLSLMVGLGFGFLWIFFAFWLFVDRGVWIYVINPLLMIFSLFVFSAVFSITVGKREQARLFTLATRDGLTGLYVIRHFRTLLNDAVMEAQKKQQPLSIILLDLDHFKKINDKYGHVAGDVALKYVSENLRLMTQTEEGGGDMNAAGRYGGEEFIVMFKNCHLIDASFNYAERIRRQLEQNSFSYEGVKISLTVSIGAATLGPGETVPDLMVLRADEALYRAKTEGRNRVCVEKETNENTPRKEGES